jgi:hypothetical protein
MPENRRNRFGVPCFRRARAEDVCLAVRGSIHRRRGSRDQAAARLCTDRFSINERQGQAVGGGASGEQTLAASPGNGPAFRGRPTEHAPPGCRALAAVVRIECLRPAHNGLASPPRVHGAIEVLEQLPRPGIRKRQHLRQLHHRDRSGIRDQGSGIRDQGSGIRDQGSAPGDRVYAFHSLVVY